jgi:hypothetical protein
MAGGGGETGLKTVFLSVCGNHQRMFLIDFSSSRERYYAKCRQNLLYQFSCGVRVDKNISCF